MIAAGHFIPYAERAAFTELIAALVNVSSLCLSITIKTRLDRTGASAIEPINNRASTLPST